MDTTKKNISIDLLPVSSGMGGGETYANSLIKALSLIDSTTQFKIFVNNSWEPILDIPENTTIYRTSFNSKNTLERFIWTNTEMINILNNWDADLHFAPFGIYPIMTSVPTIIAIHDAAYVDITQESIVQYGRTALKKNLYKLLAHKANRVITVSEFSKKRISDALSVDSNKISVVYNPLPSPTNESHVNFNPVNTRYILSVGKNYEHKNYSALVRALADVNQDTNLVIAGFDSDDKNITKTARQVGVQDRLTLAGYVSEEKLNHLYNNAEAYVQPSLYEGFGFPIIEAMEHGTPVISSTAGALPEVGGDAAYYVDPESPDDIAQGINSVLSSNELQKDLVEAGYRNIQRFNIHKFTNRLKNVFNTTV